MLHLDIKCTCIPISTGTRLDWHLHRNIPKFCTSRTNVVQKNAFKINPSYHKHNYTPRNEVMGGYTGFTLFVCPSVRPSVRPSRPNWAQDFTRTSQKNSRSSQKNYYQHSRNFGTSYFCLSHLLHKQAYVQLDEVTPVAGGLTLHSCYCN